MAEIFDFIDDGQHEGLRSMVSTSRQLLGRYTARLAAGTMKGVMRIKIISVYRKTLPCVDGAYVWGREIVTAALVHLAASTPAELHINSTDLFNYVLGTTGAPAPETEQGCLVPNDAPGSGIEPDFGSLGEPVSAFSTQ